MKKSDPYAKLIAKYPMLLKKLKSVQCGPGWLSLIEELCWKLDILLQERAWEEDRFPYVNKIEQKYGVLHVAMEWGTEEMADLINKAFYASRKICECCGNPGNVSEKFWPVTRCEECLLKEFQPSL